MVVELLYNIFVFFGFDIFGSDFGGSKGGGYGKEGKRVRYFRFILFDIV